MNRSTLAILIVMTSAVILSACSGGGRQGPARRQAAEFSAGIAGGGPGVRPGPSANEAYVAGLEKQKQGDCKGAVDLVRPVANLGPGYEGAQFALGDCLSRNASGPNAAEHHEGVMWLLRSADGGWTEAQGRLAELYALGPEASRNLPESAYWLALYRLGAELPRFGFEPLPSDRLRAVEAALSPEDREKGRARAANWQKKTWIPPTTRPAEPASGQTPRPAGKAGPRGDANGR